MIIHGHNHRDLIVSTMIYIPKDIRVGLCKLDNCRNISLYNAICNVYDDVNMYFL